MPITLPILPTAIVGSYAMPGWLERLKTDYFARRISRHDLDEIYDAAVKAAIKDQETSGLDIITDGELRRDNMVDYFAERLPGVQIDRSSKKFYYDFYDSAVVSKLPMASMGLVQDFNFLHTYTDHAAKFCVTGPHCLTKRIRNQFYPSEEAFATDIARVMNLELKALVKAGATFIQIDEPYYSGFPEDLAWGVNVINTLVEGVDAKISVHICYGNRYGKPSWEGSYRYLFPTILKAKVHQLTLEFARRGGEDLDLFKEFNAPFDLGLGVIDVKNTDIETPDMVAEHIRKALNVLPAERIQILTDCGCFHLPRDVTFAKMKAMVEGTKIVRKSSESDVAAMNPVREALTSGTFTYMVELVASAKTAEDQVVEMAAGFMQIPEIAAGSVTSFAGGSAGHDPIRIGSAMHARGLTPNIHLTCVGRDRLNIAGALQELSRVGIENVFAITGDFPKGSKETAETLYDLDSVQLVEFIKEFREQSGFPFYISAAVSPFKYTEADCAYQYLKLEKKIAAGADYAITQLGFDSRKFRELKRYLAERGLRTPVFGNVYILPLRAAEKFSKGEPPGCWASKELVEQIRAEVDASTDKGLVARMERAARMVTIVRGLGYAGAYIGGDHQAERIRWIIKRSEVLAPQWEELAAELEWGPKQGGFYFFEGPKHKPEPPTFWHRVADVVEPANTPRVLRGALTGVLRLIDKSPAAARALESAELAFKKPVFGCQACGNCVLGMTEYVCPMTCPKNLRNGPCGGTFNGQCEVIPEQACVWVKVYERAQSANRVDELKTYIPQRDRSLQGTSSYINYFLDRDSRPEHPQPLIQISGT